MTDNFRDFIKNSPGLQRAIQQQQHQEKRRRWLEETERSLDESMEEVERQRDEERRRNEEHLKASQTTAEHLAAVTNNLNEVTEALRGVHTRLDRQKADSAEENKNNRRISWLGVLFAAAAVAAPFIVLWIQNGG